MESFPEYAFVRFVCDGQKSMVPCSFIRDFKPEEFVPGQRAPVFWSPVDGETPDDVWAAQGKCLDADNSASKGKRKQKGAIAGYYSAEILKVAAAELYIFLPLLLTSSEAELSSLIDHKRIVFQTKKASESLEQRLQSSREKSGAKNSQDKSDAYVSRAKVLNMIKEGQSVTLDKLSKQYGSASNSDDSAGSNGAEESPSKCELKRKIKTLTDDLASSRKRNKRLASENKHLTDEIKLLRKLNYNLQAKVISPARSKNCSKMGQKDIKTVARNLFEEQVIGDIEKTPPMSSSPSTSKNYKEPSQEIFASVSSPISPSGEKNTTNVLSPVLVESSSENVTPTNASTPAVANDTSENNDSCEADESGDTTSSESSGGSSDRENSEVRLQLNLTPRKMKKALTGVYPKQRGDSVFIKNLAVAIFGVDLLIKSSFSGRKYSQDTNGTARPPLPSEGKEYLEKVFRQRMEAEVPRPSVTEMDLRASREAFRKAISDKIKDLRKAKPV